MFEPGFLSNVGLWLFGWGLLALPVFALTAAALIGTPGTTRLGKVALVGTLVPHVMFAIYMLSGAFYMINPDFVVLLWIATWSVVVACLAVGHAKMFAINHAERRA